MQHNDSPPLISVLVPTRNRVASLHLLLGSLDGAGSPELCETIVADNGSTDDTPILLASWASSNPRRRVIRVEQPGKTRALNAAIKVSRGKLIAFLDHDQVVDSDYLTEMA